MNGQNWGGRFNPSDYAVQTGQDPNAPVIENSDPIADNVPMDEAVIAETPLAGTAAPADEPVTHETPLAETTPYVAPASEKVTHEVPAVMKTGSSTAPLLNHEELEHFRTRWNEIQGEFVDEPRFAVQQADGLVSEVIEHLTQMFANEQKALESQFNQGGDASTEDLRKALQHYRSFFNRLVV